LARSGPQQGRREYHREFQGAALAGGDAIEMKGFIAADADISTFVTTTASRVIPAPDTLLTAGISECP